MESAVFLLLRIDTAIDGAEKFISAISYTYLGIGVANRNARKASQIGYRYSARTLRICRGRVDVGGVTGIRSVGLCRLMVDARCPAAKQNRGVDAPIERKLTGLSIASQRSKPIP